MPLNITIILTFYIAYTQKMQSKIKKILQLFVIIIFLHFLVSYFNAWYAVYTIPIQQEVIGSIHFLPEKDIVSKIKIFLEIYVMKFEPFLVGFYLWVVVEDKL